MADFVRFGRALALMVALLVLSQSNVAQCINDLGQTVNWFVSLRVPNSRIYLVYEPGLMNFRTATEALLGNAVSKLSLNSGRVMIWNDQTAFKTASSSKAHAKGVLHFDDQSGGFVMLHSIPHFVDTSEGHFDSKTRETSMYGQSIVCVSLNSLSQANTVIDHVMAQNSLVYNNTFENTVKPRPKVDRMISSMPHGFTMVTKTSISEEQPFEDLLLDHFKISWMVSTWDGSRFLTLSSSPLTQ